MPAPVAIDCQCQGFHGSSDVSVDGFQTLRESCAALRCLVPSELEEEYLSVCEAEPDAAHHIPIAFHAYRNGNLSALTRPIHEFCVQNDSYDSRVRKQYRNDLAETWIRAQTVQKRFERARRFKGRLVELMVASYLNSAGWSVNGLEMWGDTVDIRACREDLSTAFEVKHIGVDQFNFDLTVEALGSGGVSVGSVGVYSPVDYLILRVYQGALQLSQELGPKIVVAVLDDYELNFELPLKEAWVDWKSPTFFRKEADIEPLLRREYEKNPNLNEDMKREMAALSEVWFLARVTPFSLEPKVVV